MKNLVTTRLIPMGSLTGFGFNFNSINLNVFKGKIESSSSADVMIKHRGTTQRKNPQEFHVSGSFANELGTTTQLFALDNFPVNINSSGDRWNGLPAFSIYDVINNGATVSNLDFQYIYWGSSYYEASYKPYYLDGAGFQGTDYLALRLNMAFKKPVISNVTVNQSENRKPIIINWSANIQDLYDLNVIQNGIVKYSVTGTTAKTATIPANTLLVGAYEISVTVANNPYEDMGIISTLNTAFNATTINPTITSLEPNKVNQDVNQLIIASWSSTGQDAYILKLIQNNIVLKTYSGTTATNFTIPKDTFKSGTCSLELTVSNTISGVTASTTQTVSFTGFGKPDAPIIDEKYIYNNSKPTINWTSTDQVSSKTEIWKGALKIEESGEVLGIVKSYSVKIALDNLAEYVVKISVKNQFGLWSEVSTRTIKISYVVLPTPNFTLIRDAGGGILINIAMPTTATFDGCEIWRKDNYSQWVRLAVKLGYSGQWTDNTVASNTVYFYKIVATSTQGGLSESVVKSEKAYVNDFVFVDIADTNNKSVLSYNPKVGYKTVTNSITNVFAGATKPSVETDNTNYKVVSMIFDIEPSELTHFENLIYKSKVILLRDRRGLKVYGQLTGNLEVEYNEALDLYKIGFTFTEINFIERDIYSGLGALRLLKFDGTWKFDGTQSFSGVRWDG